MDTNPTPASEPVAAPATTAPAADARQAGARFGRFGRDSHGPRGPRRGPAREPRVKPEYDQKILSIRRVTRVAAGGRRFTFSVSLVAGNRKGSVGVGTGKAGDTSLAIDKAFKNARKNLVKLSLTKEMSVPYESDAKYASARVSIRPNKTKGLVAGSAARTVAELAGLKNVTIKLFSGSKNHLNNARAVVEALSEFAAK